MGSGAVALTSLFNSTTFTLLLRLRPLAHLPRCLDATAFVLVLTDNHIENQTSTELTRHHTWFGRIDPQLKLMQVLVRSIRLAESSCRRDVLLLLDAGNHVLFQRCEGGSSNAAPSCHPQLRTFARMMKRSGVQWRPVPPIVAGVPSADKLNVWLLHRYRKLAILDADMLVLAGMDDLFESAPDDELTIAQHPYDLAQGSRCGIPIGRRGVGALLVVQPNRSDYAQLTARLRSTDAFTLAHFSEQLAVACHYHELQRLHTLPCSYLHDPAVDRFREGAGGYRNCIKFGGVGRRQCRTISAHVERHCLWPKVFSRVRAVHFKGKSKPWALGYGTERGCSKLASLGRLRLIGAASGSEHSGADDIVWSGEANSCISKRRQRSVLWATGAAVPERCCHIGVMLLAEYRALRAQYCVDESRRYAAEASSNFAVAERVHSYLRSSSAAGAVGSDCQRSPSLLSSSKIHADVGPPQRGL